MKKKQKASLQKHGPKVADGVYKKKCDEKWFENEMLNK